MGQSVPGIGEDGDEHALDESEGPKGDRVARDEIRFCQGQGEETLERSDSSFSQRDDGRDEEHDDEGKYAEQFRANRVEGTGPVG
jgi:hypothetical protein